MSGLFSTPKYPDPKPPATMPDPNDTAALRAQRDAKRRAQGDSSLSNNRLAPVPGTLGREYTRSTLGAN